MRRLRNMSADNFLFITGMGIMFAFISYFGLMRLTGETVALWTYRIILYSGILTGGIYGCVRIVQKLTKEGLKLELFRTHISRRRNEAGYGVHAIEHGLCLNYGSGEVHHFTKAKPLKIETPAAIGIADTPENASVYDSLGILTRCDSVLITGGKGAGKTNLAFHLADKQMRQDCKVFVIDPKPQFESDKWAGARVIGADHDYPAIISFLSDLTGMMKNDRNQIRVWIDELIILNMRVKKFADLWLPILIEGREYGKFISIIGQSKTAGSIGLEGRYDLTNCFDAIADCQHNPADDTRFIEIGMAGQGAMIAPAPEKFRAVAYHGVHSSRQTHPERHDFRADKGESEGRDTRAERDTREIGYEPDMKEYTGKPVRYFESKAEKTAIEMSESGQSLSKIATEIFGAKSGARVKQVKAWIDKHVIC